MDTYQMGRGTQSTERQSSREQAERIVLCDLINAMIHENLLEILVKGMLTSKWIYATGSRLYTLDEGEQYFYLPVDEERTLMFRVYQQRFIQTLKVSRLPAVLLINGEDGLVCEELDPIEFMRLFAESVTEEERLRSLPNLHDFLSELADSIQQTELSLQSMQEYGGRPNDLESSLMQAERFSAYRDRPFHPTSRAKRGWDHDEYRQYAPEFAQTFGLDWIAVHRDYLTASTREDAAQFILHNREQQQLYEAAKQAGIDKDAYALLPVHPWQMKYVLPSLYQAEVTQQICVPVVSGLGTFRSTSSVRSLSPIQDGRFHVKVPIGIYSLGALRVLPPRYLQNGEKGERLLEQVMVKEPRLSTRLRMCSELNWWGFYDEKGDQFADKPGHLACLIREYPSDLLQDKDVNLIPMSALAVLNNQRQNPLFTDLLQRRYGSQVRQEQVLALFGEIAHAFIEISLICFRYGIMPEVHGQNAVLLIRNGQVNGLLLRDHDTIRLHLPWLQREGLRDPGYVVKPGTPNSLLLDTPEQLLSYFQTLGLQVNLYAMMDAMSKAYSIDETMFWREIKRAIQKCLAEIDFPSAVREVIEQQLLRSQTWPTRLLLAPLLQRVGTGGGSMPAGVGNTKNPLLDAGA